MALCQFTPAKDVSLRLAVEPKKSKPHAGGMLEAGGAVGICASAPGSVRALCSGRELGAELVVACRQLGLEVYVSACSYNLL